MSEKENEMDLGAPATRRDLKELEGATRRDLKELEGATRRDLKGLEGATRRDLKELEGATHRGLKELRTELKTEMSELRTEMTGIETRLSELIRAGFANHPTHAELDASLRQVQVHIEANRAELAQQANAIMEANRADMSAQLQQHTNAIAEDNRKSLALLDDRYRGLPDRVTKLETAVFSPPPPKRKRKAG